MKIVDALKSNIVMVPVVASVVVGTFTGIKTVKPDRDDRIFMTDGQEVIEVPTY